MQLYRAEIVHAQVFQIRRVDAPHRVTIGQTFTVRVLTKYSFPLSTRVFVGIFDIGANDWVRGADRDEILSSSGSITYEVQLRADQNSATANLAAVTNYYDGVHRMEPTMVHARLG